MPRPGIVVAVVGLLATGSAAAQQTPGADAGPPAHETSPPAAGGGGSPAAGEQPGATRAAHPEMVQPPSATRPSAPVASPLSLRELSRRLDRVQSRAEQLRARVNLLKDAALRGGASANLTILHTSGMSDQFRLVEVTYTLDGVRVFRQRDDSGDLSAKPTLDILAGPISPGRHTLDVTVVYRGHGYGPFKYLNKRTFTARGSRTFTATAGKPIRVEVFAYERRDVPLDQRPAVRFKVKR